MATKRKIKAISKNAYEGEPAKAEVAAPFSFSSMLQSREYQVYGDERWRASFNTFKKSSSGSCFSKQTKDCIGKGSFGSVYTEIGPNGEKCAVKVTRPECDNREVRVLAKTNGLRVFPDIYAAFIEKGIFNDTLYIFMELFDSPWVDLHDILVKIERKEIPDEYIKNFANTIGIHKGTLYSRLISSGIVHNDIKPGNTKVLIDTIYNVLDARFIDAGSSEEPGKPLKGCYGTPFYSLPHVVAEGGPGYNAAAQQLQFELKQNGRANKVNERRNVFSATRVFNATSHTLRNTPYKADLLATWPREYQNVSIYSRMRKRAKPTIDGGKHKRKSKRTRKNTKCSTRYN